MSKNVEINIELCIVEKKKGRKDKRISTRILPDINQSRMAARGGIIKKTLRIISVWDPRVKG